MAILVQYFWIVAALLACHDLGGAWQIQHGPDGGELSRTPVSNGCAACRDAVADAGLRWEMAEADARDPAKRRALNEYRLRREGKFARLGPAGTYQQRHRRVAH